MTDPDGPASTAILAVATMYADPVTEFMVWLELEGWCVWEPGCADCGARYFPELVGGGWLPVLEHADACGSQPGSVGGGE